MLFAMGCLVFTILGWIVLVCVPTLSRTVTNLLLFVVGAFLGTLAAGYLYGRAFADSRNELTGTLVVLGSFGAMFLGATAGGIMAVWLTVRTFRAVRRSDLR